MTTRGTSRLSLIVAVVALAGCAGHGTRPLRDRTAEAAQDEKAANRAYAGGDIHHAADLYESVVAATPDDADAWYRLGNARFRLQKLDDAGLAYERAIKLKPDHAQALYNLGVVRLKQAQAAMVASARAGEPGDSLRRDSGRIVQRLARVGDDVGARNKGAGGAPPFIVEPEDDR
ncbi:tetratricopeptide repeat protein [Luteibacter sp. OK325]|uniref:tetratricopeptide repeat protein n=1 Tax=Luteibacter sp. OK325 TaxID=2135670 RepID=UPI000D4D7495|nr:tetratricopeptide repeat protein [Luteibacter sp. OK325]PTR29948.1 tetratricopeptide repeat protein [Luteibacter sp. OK325]